MLCTCCRLVLTAPPDLNSTEANETCGSPGEAGFLNVPSRICSALSEEDSLMAFGPGGYPDDLEPRAPSSGGAPTTAVSSASELATATPIGPIEVNFACEHPSGGGEHPISEVKQPKLSGAVVLLSASAPR